MIKHRAPIKHKTERYEPKRVTHAVQKRAHPDPEPEFIPEPAPPVLAEVPPPEVVPPPPDPIAEPMPPSLPEPVPAAAESMAPKYQLKTKIGDLNFEIACQPGSAGNMRIYREDGSGSPVHDINTILLWEILKVLATK
jgi:hypothetical protein